MRRAHAWGCGASFGNVRSRTLIRACSGVGWLAQQLAHSNQKTCK
jgi:hypothetical protein